MSDGNYKIEKNIGNKKALMSDEKGISVAEITYDKPIPPQKITVMLHRSKWDGLEIATLYLLVRIKY